MSLQQNQNASASMVNPFAELEIQIDSLTKLVYRVLDHLEKDQNDLLDVHEASALTKLKPATIHNLSSRSEIPVIRRHGSRKLMFSRAALEAWITESRRKVIPIENQLLKFRSSA